MPDTLDLPGIGLDKTGRLVGTRNSSHCQRSHSSPEVLSELYTTGIKDHGLVISKLNIQSPYLLHVLNMVILGVHSHSSRRHKG